MIWFLLVIAILGSGWGWASWTYSKIWHVWPRWWAAPFALGSLTFARRLPETCEGRRVA